MAQAKKDDLVAQAGILAAAGIISRILGLIYRVPLARAIGEEGMGYYTSAYNIYTIVLLISSYSIPSAVSRVIAAKLALREYVGAQRIFRCALVYVCLVGALAGSFLYVAAPWLVDGAAVFVLRVFAPTIFLYGILGVLRGFFQAHGNMAPTSLSQVLEQAVNGLVSIGAALWLVGMAGQSQGAEWASRIAPAVASDSLGPMFGAMGSALGTGAGVAAGLLLVWALYGGNRAYLARRLRRGRRKIEGYGAISRQILTAVLPFVLATAVYNLNASLNNMLFTKIYIYQKAQASAWVYSQYGIFAGQAMTVVNIPIAFASAMAAAMLPAMSGAMARQDYAEAAAQNAKAVKATMVLTLPSALGLLILARPILAVLFGRPEDSLSQAASLLTWLAPTVVFYALSTLSTPVLQGLGQVHRPIFHALIGLALQTLVLIPLLLWTDLGLYALCISSGVYALTVSILNHSSAKMAIGYKQEWRRSFFLPLLASVLMGGFVYGIYQLSYLIYPSYALGLFLALPAGAAIYGWLVLALGIVGEEELRAWPMGGRLAGLAKRWGLF